MGKFYLNKDYNGCFLDTFRDAVSVVWDVGKIVVGYVSNDSDLVKEGSIDLAVDAVALVVPGLPAGATKIARISTNSKIVSSAISVSRRSYAGQLSVRKGREFSEMVVGSVRQEITDVQANIVYKRCLPNGTIEKAELDIIVNHTIFELKNWGRISPSEANRISQQVLRQERVGCANGLAHGGVVISDFTKISEQTREVLTDIEFISIALRNSKCLSRKA